MGGHDKAALVHLVGKHPAEQVEQDAGYGLGQADVPQIQRGSGQFEHEPELADLAVSLVAVRTRTEFDERQLAGMALALATVGPREFAEGAEFKPDTVLIKIDDAEYKLAVIRTEARVAEAHTNLQKELATAQIKREQWDDRRTR